MEDQGRFDEVLDEIGGLEFAQKLERRKTAPTVKGSTSILTQNNLFDLLRIKRPTKAAKILG